MKLISMCLENTITNNQLFSRKYRKFGWFCLIFIVILTCVFIKKEPRKSDAPSFFGAWIVDTIRINEGTTQTQHHVIGDKNYIGKFIIFTAKNIKSNLGANILTEDPNCEGPKYQKFLIPLKKLLSDTLSWHNDPLRPINPSDYGLVNVNKMPIEVISVICRKGYFGDTFSDPPKPFAANSNWFARIDDEHIVVHWYDDCLLILTRPTDRKAAAQREQLLHNQPDQNPEAPKDVMQTGFMGNWLIDDIRVDSGASKLLLNNPHDKNYIGKTITITPGFWTSNLWLSQAMHDTDCYDPKYVKKTMTMEKLLRGTLAWRNHPRRPPTPAGYGLQNVTKAPIDVFAVACGDGDVCDEDSLPYPPSRPDAGWVARIDDRHIAVNWCDADILILSRPNDPQSAAERERLLHLN